MKMKVPPGLLPPGQSLGTSILVTAVPLPPSSLGPLPPPGSVFWSLLCSALVLCLPDFPPPPNHRQCLPGTSLCCNSSPAFRALWLRLSCCRSPVHTRRLHFLHFLHSFHPALSPPLQTRPRAPPHHRSPHLLSSSRCPSLWCPHEPASVHTLRAEACHTALYHHPMNTCLSPPVSMCALEVKGQR